MKPRGYSLVELLIVIAIIGVLLTICSIAFSNWVQKYRVESQFKSMYADLMAARSQALFNKNGTGKSVIIGTASFSEYSTLNTGVTAARIKTLKVPVIPPNTQIDFDEHGVATMNGNSAQNDAYICLQTNTTSAIFNSLHISKTRIQMGTATGAGCGNANVTAQ
jgi:type IV fimbrial biogenesis protein FimT